jgi:hypothetical protein
MPITKFRQEQLSRHEPGWVTNASGILLTAHNADNAIMYGGVLIKLAASQAGASVFPRVQTVTTATDIPIGITVRPRVQQRYKSLEAANTVHDTFDIAAQKWGYPRESAIVYIPAAGGTYVYVKAEVAMNAGAEVHFVVATPGNIRPTATAGQTIQLQGWRTLENATAGESVRIQRLT